MTKQRRKIAIVSSVFVFVILFTFTGSFQSPAQNREKPIWSGASGGFTLRWTTSDINAQVANNPSEVKYSAKALAQAEFARIKKENESDPISCVIDQDYTLMSVVGSIISIQDHYYLGCEQTAHPAGESRFVAIDLSKPTKGVAIRSDDSLMPDNAVSLAEIFREEDILRALLADALIKKALANSEKPGTPKTLAQLLAAFDTGVVVAEDERNCFTVSKDLLTRFAFHHIEGDRVAVRLGLSGTGVCREFLTQIGILLPIPPSLKPALMKAEASKEGFLMKDQKKISSGQMTKLAFKTQGRTRL